MWTSFTSQSITLKPNQVHIWYVNKKNHLENLTTYWSCLNDAEREKASKFRFVKDFNCSVIARGVLRILLAKYLDKNPQEIKLDFGEFGKPILKEITGLEFNISHSSNAIVLAFTQNNKIGIDVEFTKREIEVETIAKQFFSKKEITTLAAVDYNYKQQGFYNCWTRKEAFIKALGDGLSFPLSEFSVSLDSKKEATLLETNWNKKEKEEWHLTSFEPNTNYIGALAVKGKVSSIKYWEY